MDELLAEGKQLTKTANSGEVVEGTILSIKHEALVDLGARGVGVVPRRESGMTRSFCWRCCYRKRGRQRIRRWLFTIVSS